VRGDRGSRGIEGGARLGRATGDSTAINDVSDLLAKLTASIEAKAPAAEAGISQGGFLIAPLRAVPLAFLLQFATPGVVPTMATPRWASGLESGSPLRS
jgi:hypothetical protein